MVELRHKNAVSLNEKQPLLLDKQLNETENAPKGV